MPDEFWAGHETGIPTLGAVAAANGLVADTAMRILEFGGNAIDAAIAASHAAGVVEPLDCGLGGAGFMIIHHAESGRVEAIDFLGAAPARAHYELYSSNTPQGEYLIRVMGRHNVLGHRAVAVPGAVRGFAAAHSRYGKLPMSLLFQPAIKLAEEGFPISYKGALRMHRTVPILSHTKSCRSLYLNQRGEAFAEGERIRNLDYAKTLRLVAAEGPDAFYRGDIAAAIVAEMRAHDGFLDIDDLRNYRAVWREPARGRFHGLEVTTMPPPSSGSLVFTGLDELAKESPKGEEATHEALARAMLGMFAARRFGFGDPNFKPVAVPEESAETTSLCTMDTAGNAACVTYSNNNHSGVVVPTTGMLLNNQMALFSPWPDNPNQVAPGKRPVSSMMPTLLFRDGQPTIAIGASGSTRIPTSLMQVLHRVLVQEKDLINAITEPKFHAESETMISDEDLRHIAEPLATKLGLDYTALADRDTSLGVVQAIQRAKNGVFIAVGDPRARAQGRVQ